MSERFAPISEIPGSKALSEYVALSFEACQGELPAEKSVRMALLENRLASGFDIQKTLIQNAIDSGLIAGNADGNRQSLSL
jgi:hypothetical protein